MIGGNNIPNFNDFMNGMNNINTQNMLGPNNIFNFFQCNQNNQQNLLQMYQMFLNNNQNSYFNSIQDMYLKFLMFTMIFNLPKQYPNPNTNPQINSLLYPQIKPNDFVSQGQRGEKIISVQREDYNNFFIPITFTSSTGVEYNFTVSPDETIEHAVNLFLEKRGVSIKFENIGKFGLLFSFNARSLNNLRNNTFTQLGVNRHSKINVIDIGNILGGEIKNVYDKGKKKILFL